MTTENLIKKINFPFNGFSEPIPWTDGIGFSVTQDYEDNYGSLYKFGVFKEDPKRKLKKLYISVSYGKKTDGGISIGTGKRGIWDFLDLDFHDDFFYDDTNDLLYFKDKEIEGKDLLLFIEKLHKQPTRLVRGLPIRIKLLFWRKILPFLVKILDTILIFLLWLVSGEKDKENILGRYFSDKTEQKSNEKIEKLEFAKGKTISFFGYEARRWSVVFYCSLHFVIYFFAFFLPGNSNLLASRIGHNNFLSICYVVVSFAVIDFLIPKIIKDIIKETPKIFVKVAFKTIKVK